MKRLRLTRIAMAVMIFMTACSISLFFVIRSSVADQERRILQEHAGELNLLLDQSIQSIGDLLPLAGEAVPSSGHATRSFDQIGRSIVGQVSTSSVAIVRRTGVVYRTAARVGKEAIGPTISGGEAVVLRRASRTKGLVSGIVHPDGGRTLLLALAMPNGLFVLEESDLGPVTTNAPPPPAAPFGDVNLAFYASAHPTPAALILISGTLPTGLVDRQSLSVGADHWLILVSARTPLVGTLTNELPWVALLAGLLLTMLVVALIEGLARRRSYALQLVETRTSELRSSLSEQGRLQEAERAARHEAERANRVKSQFISRMSHELRTPLNSVIGFGQLLERDQLSDDQKDSVEHILKGGKHLLALVNEVLDIARIEAGDLALSPEPVHVADMLSETLGLIGPLASQRAIRVVRSQEEACSCYVLADRHRLQQVLLNVLSNAVKYNREGGIIAVTCEHLESSRLRVKISDTGQGIPQEQLGRLFLPFERLGAEQSGIEGTGIGLALSRQLTEAMGGTMGLETASGVGSTFWVELPLVEGPLERFDRVRPDRLSRAEEVPSAPRRTLLYIEDNLANIRLVERILQERENIDIIPAMQGRLGLELARQHQPSMILLDLHLSDISGDEVLRRLLESDETSRIPVVILSADATPGRINRLLHSGAVAFLTKPVDADELLQVLDDNIFSPARG